MNRQEKIEIQSNEAQDEQERDEFQNPGGHKEGRASFPIQSQYKVSKIHTLNPTLEKRKGGRKEGREGRQEKEGRLCSCARGKGKREREGEGVFNPNNSQPKRLNYP